MKMRSTFTQIAALAGGLLLLGGLGAFWPALVGADLTASTLAPGDVTADAITYQGYLTDENNIPLNGTYTMQFEIYNAQAGGTLLYDSLEIDIKVTNGLFEVRLPITGDIFNGEELWLAQTVNNELLTPRQEILPSPMAHTLRPGAIIKGTASAITNNYTVEVHMDNDTSSFNRGAITGQATTGNAIYGLANSGRAVYGQTQDGYAVYGFDGGSLPNRGYAGYFYSTNGIGVYGYSGANRANPNIYAPGVYGQSNRGVGVYGRGDTSNSASFNNQGGHFVGGNGLFARGTDSESEIGSGYGAQFFSDDYVALFARGDSDDYDAIFDGSQGIFVNGSVINSAANTTVMVVNTGETAIEPGDLVAMAGVAESYREGQPMLAVAAVDATNQNAVIGVAKEAIAVTEAAEENESETIGFSPAEGTIEPGSYLVIITDGLAPAVNLSSLNSGLTAASTLAIGDKIALSTGSETTQSAVPTAGIVIGKVAGPIDEATGTVPMFIDID